MQHPKKNHKVAGLFIFKSIGRIHQGSPVSMYGGYQQGDHQAYQGRNNKDNPLQIDVLGEAIQPLVYSKPRQGPAYKNGDQDQPEEFL